MVSTLVAMSTNKGINFICYTNKEFSAITSLNFSFTWTKTNTFTDLFVFIPVLF